MFAEQHNRKHKQYTQEEIDDIIADGVPAKRYLEKKITNKEIFTNQIDCGRNVYTLFLDKSTTTVMIIGRTQSGKTGCILCCIHEFLTEESIPIENIYIVTGLSSNDWKIQMRNRFHRSLHDNIMDRTTFLKNIEKISKKHNILIIIDEVQIASLESQSMTREIKEYLKDIMYSHDIKIIELSATPNGTTYDNPDLKKVKLYPGQNYTSLFDIKNMGNTRQFK